MHRKNSISKNFMNYSNPVIPSHVWPTSVGCLLCTVCVVCDTEELHLRVPTFSQISNSRFSQGFWS